MLKFDVVGSNEKQTGQGILEGQAWECSSAIHSGKDKLNCDAPHPSSIFGFVILVFGKEQGREKSASSIRAVDSTQWTHFASASFKVKIQRTLGTISKRQDCRVENVEVCFHGNTEAAQRPRHQLDLLKFSA